MQAKRIASSTSLSLAELVQPLSPQSFLAEYWQKKPYVRHGPLERFGALASIRELRTIEALLGSWRGQTEVWAARGTGNPVITAEAHQLSAFYDSGYTLYLSRVEQYVPALVPFARSMELELGLRIGDVYFEAFISKGAGSVVHFDPNVTINLQLLGSKKWWMAENKHVAHPHLGWAVGTEVDEQMAAYARQPFPTRMPPTAQTFEARRGTLVYLHPGYWHSTSNHEPSLSLLYTINPPSWAELLLEELRRLLLRVPEARELAFGLGSAANHESQTQRLRSLLSAIEGASRTLVPDDLLERWGGALRATFAPVAEGELALEEQDAQIFLSRRQGRKLVKLELESDAAPVVLWILARPSAFTGQEVAAGVRGVSSERVTEILEALEAEGFLSRCGSPSTQVP
jgi:50S ribosomal protein L16 3-hydroxylase